MAILSIISLTLYSVSSWLIKYLFCSKATLVYGMISYHLLITYGVHLYSWLEGRLLNIEEFDIRTTINKLDRFLITKNIASRINVDHNKPMDGIHFNKNFGLVWFYRKTEPAGYDKEPHTTYTIYSIYKCNIEQIRSFLETNNINDIITVIKVISPAPWQHKISKINVREISIPWTPQYNLSVSIKKEYENKNNQSILISGDYGTGKSKMGRILYSHFRETGIEPYLVEDFNPSSKGLHISSMVIENLDTMYKHPIILMLDEIDIAFYKSKETNDDSEFIAHSSNKTEMCNFLDLINDIPFMITIATTNISLEKIKDTYPEYTREGRFNNHITFEK